MPSATQEVNVSTQKVDRDQIIGLESKEANMFLQELQESQGVFRS